MLALRNGIVPVLDTTALVKDSVKVIGHIPSCEKPGELWVCANMPKARSRRHKLVSTATDTRGGIVRARHQKGYLRVGRRKTGPTVGSFCGGTKNRPECASVAKLSLAPSSSIQMWKTLDRRAMASAYRSMRPRNRQREQAQKHVGWHTFRHSFSTMLIANGENVKVAQELMRHSNCRCTLEIYSQAQIQAKRDAQHRVIEMIAPRPHQATDSFRAYDSGTK
jgi:integrase